MASTHFLRTDNLGHVRRFEPTLTKAEQTAALGGTFTLELAALGAVDIGKGDHIIYYDDTGALHDTIVVSPSVTHGAGGLATSIVCKDRIATDMADIWVEDVRQPKPTALGTILSRLLSNTPFGTLGAPGGQAAISFYHETMWKAVCDLSTAAGMEVARSYAKPAGGEDTVIPTASIGLVGQLGASTLPPRRFDYGYDLTGCSRTITADPVYTRMHGYGKGLKTDAGGYSRKLTFASINGGKNYVDLADTAYAGEWNFPDPAHKRTLPRTGVYENANCEDAKQLLAETKNALLTASRPIISYELTVTATGGLDTGAPNGRPVELGETVQVVDAQLGLRLTARVSRKVTDLLTGRSTITLGAQGESFTAQTTAATSSTAASATAAYTASQAAVATQADIAPTVTRVKTSGDGWDKAATLANTITLSAGLPCISYDGHTYIFSPDTGTFIKEA